jgi:hypothetical protein
LNNLLEQIDDLEAQHQNALMWFKSNSGQELPWPGMLDDGTLLVTKAKGIYKPKWSKFALSIRRQVASPYPDIPPVVRADGSWKGVLPSGKSRFEFLASGLYESSYGSLYGFESSCRIYVANISEA